jgi:hypothetical protein
VVTRRTAGDVHRFEWLVGGVGAVGFDGHGVPLKVCATAAGVAGQAAMVAANAEGKPGGDCLGL